MKKRVPTQRPDPKCTDVKAWERVQFARRQVFVLSDSFFGHRPMAPAERHF